MLYATQTYINLMKLNCCKIICICFICYILLLSNQKITELNCANNVPTKFPKNAPLLSLGKRESNQVENTESES